MLLIHPMLASNEAMRSYLVENILKEINEYRFIIPDLSGHGEAADEIYESAAEEARMLSKYLLEHGLSEVDLGFAASLGGVVLFEMLNLGEIKFKRLFFEGVSFYESSKLGGFLMTKNNAGEAEKGVKKSETCGRENVQDVWNSGWRGDGREIFKNGPSEYKKYCTRLLKCEVAEDGCGNAKVLRVFLR